MAISYDTRKKILSLETAFYVDPSEVANFCKQVDLNVSDYIIETQKALASHNGADQFSYSMENSQFMWKKLVGNIKVKFGCIHLKKISEVSSLNLFVGNILDEIHAVQNEVKSLKEEKERLIRDKNDLMKKLEQFATEKSHQEAVLYGKFLSILNAKKEKILELQTTILGEKPELQAPDFSESQTNKRSEKWHDSTVPKRTLHKKSGPFSREKLELGNGDTRYEDSDTVLEEELDDPPVACKNSIPSHSLGSVPRRKRPIKCSRSPSPERSNDSDTDIEGAFASHEPNHTAPSVLPKRKCPAKSPTLSSPRSSKDAYHYDSDTDVDEDTKDDETSMKVNNNLTILPRRVASSKRDKPCEEVLVAHADDQTQLFDTQFLFADDK
ncbi:DNA repair protein XRCC4 isoform X2 [Anabrus simplex]|uniref:DNA repair protein XRCC4 isoform X2 n=1 Tax=Anabrus simplex TaxID=316456 RepID=UPI0035A38250